MPTYFQKQNVVFSSSEDDNNNSSASSSDDHPPIIRGVLSSPSSDYLILSFLGEGTYGQVAKCIKTATKETVAVKMFKNHNMTAVAKNEVTMLEKMRQFDPDRFNFVRFNDTFINEDNICIEFEMLQMSLLDFLCKRPEHCLTVKEIRPILYQVATTLTLLQSQGIVHTDLKPDNIMLVDHVKYPLKVKMIDFGLACYVPEPRVCSYIQACVYRAPEVILGIPFTSAIDMWALGCIAAELFLGSLLFPGRNDYNVLQGIIETQGQIPQRMVKRSLHKKLYFRNKRTKGRNRQYHWTLKTPEEYGEYEEEDGQFLHSLEDILKIRPPCHLSKEDTMVELEDQGDFVELLKQMLHVDADKRIKPSQLMEDPFITMKYQAESYPTSLYLKSCCEAMEVCRDSDPDGQTESNSPAWQNYWEHPLILHTASALSTSLNIHDSPSLQPQELSLAKQEWMFMGPDEPTVNEESSSRGDTKPARKRKRLSFEVLLRSHRNLQQLIPAKKKKRVDPDIVKANEETQTETSTVPAIPRRKRTWDEFKAAHPESINLEPMSPVKKKMRMDLVQAPSEANPQVPVRNGTKDTRSLEKKTNLSDVSPKATSDEGPKNIPDRSQLKRPRSGDGCSPKQRKVSLRPQTPKEVQEPKVNEDNSGRGNTTLAAKQKASSLEDLNRSQQNLVPAKTMKRVDPDVVKANTVPARPRRKRTLDELKAAHPESSSLEMKSPARKKMRMDLICSSKQAPSKPSSRVQVRSRSKGRRNTEEDRFRNGSKDRNSPERKRRKMSVYHDYRPSSSTTEPSLSAATQTVNRDADNPKKKRRRKEAG